MPRPPRTTFLILVTLLTVVGAAGFTWRVVRPAWTSPRGRTFESRLGYASVMRARGEPFPVVAAIAEPRPVEEVFLGEGLVQATPLLVPVVPMATVARVFVQVGDYVEKGQLLAKLDTRRIDLKVAAAHAALETARAEYERVRIGSPHDMAQERPGLDGLKVKALESELSLARESLEIHEDLHSQGLVSRDFLLQKRLSALEVEEQLNQARWALETAEVGQEKSLAIARSTVRESELELEFRQLERRDHQIFAPASGVVQRVLLHEGEYNQDPGRPAFLVATGAWFEAHLDQTCLGRVAEDDPVEVFLEAHPGRPWRGRVERIMPFVSYGAGGPESDRPIRPGGTGAPEWPATFTVRVTLEDQPSHPLVPGLTGFARVRVREDGVSIPRSALLSLSAASAVVHVVQDDRWEVRQVTVGALDDRWAQVVDGLEVDEQVLVEGHDVLEPGDPIRLVEELHPVDRVPPPADDPSAADAGEPEEETEER